MHRPTFAYALLAGALSLLLGACEVFVPANPPGPTEIETPGAGEPVIYSRHIQPILTTSCASADCHARGSSVTGLVVDSWEHVMEGSDEFGAVVVPYASVKSHLFQHVNTDTTLGPTALPRMPLGRDPLPIEQIRTIKRWIDEGAKNDRGDVALAGETRPRIFVTAQSDDQVSVLDLATLRVMRYFDVGTLQGGAPESPHNIVLSPDNRYLYVNLIAAGSIEKYDARSFAKLGATRVGLSPAQIAITRDGSTLYVSNFDNTLQQHFIVRVNAATMTVTDTIFDVGDAPHGVTLGFYGGHLYTTNALGDDISEIDLNTLEISKRILISPNNPLPQPGAKARYEPYQSEFSADGKTLWVTCRASAEVRVIDMEQGRVVDSIKVGKAPLILKMTPDGGELWVPNRNSDDVSIINVASRSVVATIANLKTQPHAVAFTADGKTAFVSCENQNGEQHHPTHGSARAPGILYVIDVATRSIKRKIEIGSFAAGVEVSD